MKPNENQILMQIDELHNLGLLVSILELTVSKLDINTISGMAASENKSPRGIRTSNAYRKVNIGRSSLAVKGVRDLNNLPF